MLYNLYLTCEGWRLLGSGTIGPVVVLWLLHKTVGNGLVYEWSKLLLLLLLPVVTELEFVAIPEE